MYGEKSKFAGANIGEGLLRRFAPCPSGNRRLRLRYAKHFVLCRTPPVTVGNAIGTVEGS